MADNDTTFIGPSPPAEMYAPGLEIDRQCARCGSSCVYEWCGQCDDGYVSRYEEDPLWYDQDDLYPCDMCGGHGGWNVCCSDAAWCKANPLPGRENVDRGAIEWFTIKEQTT